MAIIKEKQMGKQLASVTLPRIVLHIDILGSNSLLGALGKEFIKRDCIQYVGRIHPTEIVFVLKKAHTLINIYEEINLVRDVLKIPEDKIIVNFI